MKNKLTIVTTLNDSGEVLYKVQDFHNIYMLTTNKAVAENTYKLLKQEYNREHSNAS